MSPGFWSFWRNVSPGSPETAPAPKNVKKMSGACPQNLQKTCREPRRGTRTKLLQMDEKTTRIRRASARSVSENGQTTTDTTATNTFWTNAPQGFELIASQMLAQRLSHQCLNQELTRNPHTPILSSTFEPVESFEIKPNGARGEIASREVLWIQEQTRLRKNQIAPLTEKASHHNKLKSSKTFNSRIRKHLNPDPRHTNSRRIAKI